LPSFKEAAPYTIGTHFKDHFVCPRPNGRPMNFEVTGAALGDGDVPLRECYEVLKAGAPNPDGLVMEIEMIAPQEGMTPIESMERSVAFIRGLE
jgi:sugar phosphate isomerase/epimerase